MNQDADPMARFRVEEVGDTVVVEWDNRRFAKNRKLTIAAALFWLAWTLWLAFALWMGVGNLPYLLKELLDIDLNPIARVFVRTAGIASLLLAGAGVVLVPLAWLCRYATERVELSAAVYRHYFVELSWLFPKRWAISDITRVELGRVATRDGRESFVSLSIWKRKKRDQLAYWLENDAQRELFRILAPRLRKLNRDIAIVPRLLP